MAIDKENNLHTIGSLPPVSRSSTTLSERYEVARQAHVTTALVGLAVHYYRPDFSEGQARVLIRDMLEDLAEFSVPDVEAAVKAYRRDANSKFFPTSGQLRKLAREARAETRDMTRHKINFEFGDSRPLMWWCQSKALWKKHWREDEIPERGKSK